VQLTGVDVVFPNASRAILTYRAKQEIAPRGEGTSIGQEMNDTPTWIQKSERWQCVMHMETPEVVRNRLQSNRWASSIGRDKRRLVAVGDQ
jgi:hypothetical protein